MPFIRQRLWPDHELKFNAAACVTIKRDYTAGHIIGQHKISSFVCMRSKVNASSLSARQIGFVVGMWPAGV